MVTPTYAQNDQNAYKIACHHAAMALPKGDAKRAKVRLRRRDSQTSFKGHSCFLHFFSAPLPLLKMTTRRVSRRRRRRAGRGKKTALSFSVCVVVLPPACPPRTTEALLVAAVLQNVLHIPHTYRQTQRLSACARAVSSAAQTDGMARDRTHQSSRTHGESETASEGHFASWHFLRAPACF